MTGNVVHSRDVGRMPCIENFKAWLGGRDLERRDVLVVGEARVVV